MSIEVDLRVDLNTEDDTGLPWAFLRDARDPALLREGAWLIVGPATLELTDLELALDRYPLLLTIEETAEVLRISRSLAYELARRYGTTDGTAGIAVMRVGACLRAPASARTHRRRARGVATNHGTSQRQRPRQSVDRPRSVGPGVRTTFTASSHHAVAHDGAAREMSSRGATTRMD
jgi:hypothetical protein